MLTDRDKRLLRFIEENRAITTQQARWIFFNGLETSTIRRLNQLENDKILISYYCEKSKVYQYNESSKVSKHDLGSLEFYSWIYKNSGQVLEFKREPRYFNGILRPDARIKFKMPYEGCEYTVNAFLEYDLNHYTENTKLSAWYEKLALEIEEFVLIIARPTKSIMYNPKNFSVVYTDMQFNNVLQLLLG